MEMSMSMSSTMAMASSTAMSMAMPTTPSYSLPWLDSPIMLHSSRADTCKLTAAQCAYRQGHWRYWYQADHVYALNTVYFCCAIIGVFAIGHHWSLFWSGRQGMKTRANRAVTGLRFISYKGVYVKGVDWYSQSIGIMLLGLLGVVFFFSMTFGPEPYYWPNTKTVSYGGSPPLATRAGWMALGLFPFTIVLASKTNWITIITGVPHEKLQVFHRWSAWAMFVLALIHTFPFIVVHIQKGDMMLQWQTSLEYWTGVAALIPQAYLTIFSIGPLRNRYYEIFKSTHWVAFLLFAIFFFVHCDFRLTSWDYFIAAFVLYGSSLIYTYAKTFFEIGMHWAHLEYSQNMIKVEVLTIMKWKPGQHIFVRFLTGAHGLTSHPFSICSLPSKNGGSGSLVFYIKPRGGITGRIAALAAQNPPKPIRVFLDGPYGGFENGALKGYNEVLLIAGGSGGGFLLPLLEELLICGCADGAEPTKFHLVLAVREEESLAWFMEALHDMMPETPCLCAVELGIYVTGKSTSKSLDSGSDTEKGNISSVEKVVEGSCYTPPENKNDRPINRVITVHHEGRPSLPSIVKESVDGNQSVAVVVCGPGSMVLDVRNATAEAQKVKGKNVWLHTESFSW